MSVLIKPDTINGPCVSASVGSSGGNFQPSRSKTVVASCQCQHSSFPHRHGGDPRANCCCDCRLARVCHDLDVWCGTKQPHHSPTLAPDRTPRECVLPKTELSRIPTDVVVRYYHFVIPRRGLRQRFGLPVPSNGLKGSPKKWQERTPAMAAGLTDHIWTMDELLSFRVPPKSM